MAKPVPYAIFGPVGSQASWFGFIKDADTLFNISDDGSFGFLKELIVPVEGCARLKKLRKGSMRLVAAKAYKT